MKILHRHLGRRFICLCKNFLGTFWWKGFVGTFWWIGFVGTFWLKVFCGGEDFVGTFGGTILWGHFGGKVDNYFLHSDRRRPFGTSLILFCTILGANPPLLL